MSWSFSSWSTYNKCPARYEYAYIFRLPRGPTSPSAARGTLIHSSIEAFLNKDLQELPTEINFYTQFLTDLRDNETYKLRPELKVALNDKWEVTEWDAPDVWFKGVLDLYVEADGRVIVYDWKTGKEYPDHSAQREVYAIAAGAYGPEVSQIESFHVYLDSRQTRGTNYFRDLLPVLRNSWADKVSPMLSGKEYIPLPGFHCRYCPYSSKFGERKGPCRF